MNEKISNKLLAIPITFTFIIIAIFCFFCIGLSRVDAKVEITFVDSERMRNGTGTSATNYGTLLSECTNSTYCVVPSSNIFTQRIMVANYTRIDSTVANETYLILNGNNYTINYKVLLYKTNGDIISVKPTMAFMNSSNQWVLATCDSGQSYNSTIKSVSNGVGYTHVQTFEYKCNFINSTLNGNSVRFGIYSDTTNGAFSGTIGWQIDTKITDNTRVGTDTDKIINNQNQNAQDIINNANQNTDKITDAIEKSEETNQGILDVITNFFSNFFDGLIGIFVPNNFDFLTGFLDTLENKLGFIASIPIQFLEFLGNLVTIDFDTVTSVTLPNFEILGYKFIEEQEIDLSEIMAVFQPYRIYTNIACVCLCIRYLMKLYENFANKE